jgi:pSer/pThr/pTyr-binding forkhead associated (FHA) protein
MSKITLQYEGTALKEFAVDSGLTIGRLPDNVVVIDNPAVSGHHARIVREGDSFVFEDLKSTNGTFVNGRHVSRHVLQDGDEVLIGKHHLKFSGAAAERALPVRPLEGLGDTVYLDTQRHRALRATLDAARAEAGSHSSHASGGRAAARRLGVLRVVSGHADRAEYDLTGNTSLIGRSGAAVVRLRGWFKPTVAVAIARSGEGYVATRMGGRSRVNDAPLTGRHWLEDGDLLHVGGLTLAFAWKDQASKESAA